MEKECGDPLLEDWPLIPLDVVQQVTSSTLMKALPELQLLGDSPSSLGVYAVKLQEKIRSELLRRAAMDRVASLLDKSAGAIATTTATATTAVLMTTPTIPICEPTSCQGAKKAMEAPSDTVHQNLDAKWMAARLTDGSTPLPRIGTTSFVVDSVGSSRRRIQPKQRSRHLTAEEEQFAYQERIDSERERRRKLALERLAERRRLRQQHLQHKKAACDKLKRQRQQRCEKAAVEEMDAVAVTLHRVPNSVSDSEISDSVSGGSSDSSENEADYRPTYASPTSTSLEHENGDSETHTSDGTSIIEPHRLAGTAALEAENGVASHVGDTCDDARGSPNCGSDKCAPPLHADLSTGNSSQAPSSIIQNGEEWMRPGSPDETRAMSSFFYGEISTVPETGAESKSARCETLPDMMASPTGALEQPVTEEASGGGPCSEMSVCQHMTVVPDQAPLEQIRTFEEENPNSCKGVNDELEGEPHAALENGAVRPRRYQDIFPCFECIFTAHQCAAKAKRRARVRAAPEAPVANTLRSQFELYSTYDQVLRDYATLFDCDGVEWEDDGQQHDSQPMTCSGNPSALQFRVSSRRPEIRHIVFDVLISAGKSVTNEGEWEELPTGLGLKTTWNLLWTWSNPHVNYRNLLVWQQVNHFTCSRELTRKDRLKANIQRFVRLGGAIAKEWDIMPQTFILPHEFTSLVTAFNEAKEQADRSTGGLPDAGDDNLWIMKPVGMSRGRGIQLVSDIWALRYSDMVVVQRYLAHPLLLDGYKFDLRLYVLVTSFSPLEAFIYREGFARLSTHRYTSDAVGLNNLFIHLTNSSVQRLNMEGATQDNPLRAAAETNEAGGTKASLAYLWRRLSLAGVAVSELWENICEVVVKSLLCCEPAIPHEPNAFELFGYDLIIDKDLRPWLLEVNASPQMNRDSQLDCQLKEALIRDTVALVSPCRFNRSALLSILERRISESSRKASVRSSSTSRRDADILEEDLNSILLGNFPRQYGEMPAKLGGYARLCPGSRSFDRASEIRKKHFWTHAAE